MAIPDIVFCKTSSIEHVAADSVINIFVPSSLAGNCLIICIQTGTLPNADPTATDNIGTGTWAVAKGVVGNQRLSALVQTNCPAGVNHITVTLQNTETFIGYFYVEAYNISQAVLATALDGTSGATLISGSPVASGSITTVSDRHISFQFALT